MARDRSRLIAGAGLPAVAIAALVIYPVVTIIGRSFDAGNLVDTVTSSSFRRTLRLTLTQATASTALSFAVGFPLAGVLSRRRVRGAKVLTALVTIPFVMPTVVVASAYIALFRSLGLDDGAVDLTEGLDGVVLAHAFFNIAVVVRIVGVRWMLVDFDAVDAARTLGASPVRAFLSVTLPALRRAATTAAALVFLFCITSFGVIRVLGGPRVSTIETEIYRHAILRVDTTTATSLAVIQLAVVAAALAIARSWIVESPAGSIRRTASALPALVGKHRLWAGLTISIGTAYLLMPLLAIVARAVTSGGSLTTRHLGALDDESARLGVSPLDALTNSVQIALVAAAFALVIGATASTIVARGGRVGKAVGALCALPLAVSAVTLGLGMIVAFDEPIDLRASWIVVPLAHAAIGVPLVVGAVTPSLLAINDDLREAASVLSASPRHVARFVVAPLVARGAAVGAAFAFAVSLGEFGASSFLARRSDQLTAPLAVERLLGRPGAAAEGQAAALAVAIMVVIGVAVLAADRLAVTSTRGARRS